MKRKIAIYSTLVLAGLLLLLLSACGGEVAPTTAEPSATAVATETAQPPAEPSETAVATETAQPEATSPPEKKEGDSSGETDPGEIVVERTPAPTPTPDLIADLVSEATDAIGLTGQTFLGLKVEDWINLVLSLLMGLGGYLLGTWLIRGLLRRVVRRTPTKFDDELLEAIGHQLRWLVVIFVLQFSTTRLTFLSVESRTILGDIFFLLYFATVFLILWRLLYFAADWYHRYLEPEDAERLDPVITLAYRGAQAIVVMIAVIIFLGQFGINVTGLAAALGIAGLGISLAAKDTLSDAISGIIILVDRPFRTGDRIEISGLNTWGDVVEIGLRSTRIRTRDNRLVIVPNSAIANSQVINYTYPDPRYRIQIEIGIGYGTDIEKARRVIVDTVRKVEDVLPDKPVDALYVEMGDSAMIFRVRWWIESYVDTRHVFDRVNTALQKALDEAGIDMPYPTQSVNLQIDRETAQQISETLRERK